MAKKIYQVKNFVRMDMLYLQSFKVEADNMQDAMDIVGFGEIDPYFVEEYNPDSIQKYMDFDWGESFILQKKDIEDPVRYAKVIDEKAREFIGADPQELDLELGI